MRAAALTAYGGIDQLEVKDLLRPSPGPGEVLVRVRSAALNPVDWKIREGELKFVFRLKFPTVLGFDVAGDVEELGPGVTDFARDDPVFGKLSRPGSHAEFAVAKAGDLVRKPASMTYEEAAAIPVAGLSALQALRSAGRGRQRPRVLLNGAGGGVGLFAVQIGRAMGASVTAVASAGKRDLLLDLGASETVDYAAEDFTSRDETYDVVFDIVPNRSFSEVRSLLAPRGVYVTTLPSPSSVGYAIATRLMPPLFGGCRCDLLMLKQDTDGLRELAAMAEAGQLRAVIGARFSLDEIREAYEHGETGHSTGKTILRIS